MAVKRKKLQIRISKTALKRFKAKTKRNRTDMSEVTRRLIIKYLNNAL
jgi:hypothetical protein